MAVVSYTPRAELDLREIWSYIAANNERAACQLLDRIRDSCRAIAPNPLLGTSAPTLAPALRYLVVGSYIIFYLPLDDGSGIRVIRVVHGARDVPTAFREGLDELS